MAAEDEDPMWKVQLYVYDLTQGMAKQLSQSLLGQEIEGIWHTGVVVFNNEYFYGGGIQRMKPGTTIVGNPHRVIELGETAIPQEVFHEFLREISSRFTPDTYSILNHNCNNFSSEACQFLTGSDIPSWITGLPETVLATPLGAMLRPMIENMDRQMRGQGGNMGFQFESEFSSPEPSSSSSSEAHSQPEAKEMTNNSSSQDQKEAKEPPKPKEDENHIHRNLDLSSINEKPVFSEDEKAEQFVRLIRAASKKKSNADFQLTESELETLASITDHLKSPKDKPTFPEIFELFDRLINEWSTDTLFSAVSLLRLLVLRPHATRYFTSEDGGISSIYTLIMKVGLSDEERIAKKHGTVCLMTLCLLSNLFSVEDSARRICFDECIVGAAICALSQKDVSVRLMGATVLFNCALFLPKHANDISSQIACSLQEVSEEETHKVPRYRMLMAILHLAYCNTETSQLLKSLEFSPSTNSKEVAVTAKIKRVINELEILLEATPEQED